MKPDPMPVADRDGQPYLKETEYRVLHRVLNRLHLKPPTANSYPPANPIRAR